MTLSVHEASNLTGLGYTYLHIPHSKMDAPNLLGFSCNSKEDQSDHFLYLKYPFMKNGRYNNDINSSSVDCVSTNWGEMVEG